MLTTDENIVDMQFVVQYRLRADSAHYLFKMRDPDESVRQAAKPPCAKSSAETDGLRALRGAVPKSPPKCRNLMQQILDRYNAGIQISTVAIRTSSRPRAGAGRVRRRRQGGPGPRAPDQRSQAYANQVVPLASGRPRA